MTNQKIDTGNGTSQRLPPAAETARQERTQGRQPQLPSSGDPFQEASVKNPQNEAENPAPMPTSQQGQGGSPPDNDPAGQQGGTHGGRPNEDEADARGGG